MDFRLSPQSDAFRVEVREFLAEHLTTEIVERAHETGTVHDWTFHRALAAKGWLAASWPEELGGQGRDPYEMIAMREELALAHAPVDGMAITNMIATTLLHVGSDEQKARYIPAAIKGELLFSLGYSEPDSGSDVAAAKTKAVRDGDEWVINGQKMFTTLAQEASYVFLLARTDTNVAKHKGLTIFIVPLDTPGIEIQPVHTLGGERINITFYTDVRIPDSARVGAVNGGWQVMTVALTFERGGGGKGQFDNVLHHAEEWARTTAGAGAAMMIDDPLIRERLARVAAQTRIARLLGYRTAWTGAQGRLPGVEGSMHKLYSAERFVEACSDLLDMTGPAGVRKHGDPLAPGQGWIEHAHRHAAVTTIYGGTSEIQREIIAQRGLGLPRAR